MNTPDPSVVLAAAPSFVEGDHVKVTITGRVVGLPGDSLLAVGYTIVDGQGLEDDVHVSVHPGHDAVNVERLAPPEWPPKRGDVWADRYGYQHFCIGPVLVDEDGISRFARELDQPATLVSRRGNS